MSRMYQPSWEALKASKTKSIQIVAHSRLHARIYKAVIKEKDMDTVFKLELADDCKRATLSHTSKDNILTISIRYSIGLSDL
jgi:hypothetical protein